MAQVIEQVVYGFVDRQYPWATVMRIPMFSGGREGNSGKSENIKPRNLSLLCSPLAPTENNYSAGLQLQLC